MKATLKDGKLTIEIDVQEKPSESSTGKTLVVASSHGNQPVGIQVGGETLRIGVNAFIPNKAAVKK